MHRVYLRSEIRLLGWLVDIGAVHGSWVEDLLYSCILKNEVLVREGLLEVTVSAHASVI